MTSQKKHTVMAVVLMLGYVDLLTYFGGGEVMLCVGQSYHSHCSAA